MFSLCFCGFSVGVPVSPTIKTCTLGLSPVSTVDQGTCFESEIGPAALQLPTAPQGWVKCTYALYTVYVTNKVPLPLIMVDLKCPVLLERLRRNYPVITYYHKVVFCDASCQLVSSMGQHSRCGAVGSLPLLCVLLTHFWSHFQISVPSLNLPWHLLLTELILSPSNLDVSLHLFFYFFDC